MRIGIDVRCLAEGRRTGVEEYTLNLLENLFKIDQKNEFVLFFNSFRASRINFTWIKKYPNVTLKKFNYPNKILNFLFWYFNWPKIDNLIGGVDIFFIPNIIFGSVSKKVKLIVTIHDLSFEKYPETFSLKRRFWHIFINPKKICRQADKIIAVSESTKNDLVSLYKIKPEKVETILSGISEKFRVIDRNEEKLIKVKEKYNLPYRFMLYLGTIEPRKNISAIVTAYEALQNFSQKNKPSGLNNCKLVIAGQKGWLTKKILTEINTSAYKKNIILVDFVEDEDKEYFYNLSSLFVYPSFFEGFGFPPLEAMKCGIPIIASNNSSLPEIVGRGGILVDPDKPGEILEAMKQILDNKELWLKLKTDGLLISSNLNWGKTARKFINIANNL